MRSFKTTGLILLVQFFVYSCATVNKVSGELPKTRLQPVTMIELPIVTDKPEKSKETYYDPNSTRVNLFDTHGHERQRAGKYFFVRDFSHTGDIAFRYARIDPELVTCLNEIRNQMGRPIIVNSAYRSWAYNDQLIQEGQKASQKSFHLSGKAADVYISKVSTADFVSTAYSACGCGTGVGVASGWYHIDTRGRSVRPWGYSNTSKFDLNTAIRVHKSTCGGGGQDWHEIGLGFVDRANGLFNKVKSAISNVIQ